MYFIYYLEIIYSSSESSQKPLSGEENKDTLKYTKLGS